MTCQEYDGQIDDYVDGSLAESIRLDCEAHLATCASCRALTIDLQTIKTATRTLEPQVPSPQVWYKLAAAIEADSGGVSAVWFGGWQRAAAGAVTCAMLIASLSWIGSRLTPAAREHERMAAAPSSTVIESTPLDAADFTLVEQQYTSAIAGLEDITRGERSSLDSNTADVLTASLTVIDGAIGESRAALDKEPESAVAQDSLVEALRNKVALLQDIVALINAVRFADADGTARIVTGLSQ
jgi:Putative zinc-finger